MGQFYSLDYSKLDSILKDIKNTTLDYFPYFQEAFILLYETGCRVGELFEITRWRRINDTTLGLTPQKFNSERLIVIPAGVTLFPQWVDNQVVPWFGLSVVQLNALFMRYSPYTSYLAETKPISLYLFRYRYIRYLASNGWSLAGIQTIMGYSSQTVIHNYLNSVLRYFSEAPVIPTVVIGGRTWFSSNLAINDGGVGISAPNGDSSLVSVFGYLYSFEALTRVVSSVEGFRLPTREELDSLVVSAGGSSVAGGNLKSVSTSFWDAPNSGATDSLSFGLRGSGFYGTGKVYTDQRKRVYLWSSTPFFSSSIYVLSVVYDSSSSSVITRPRTHLNSARLIAI